MLGVFSRSSKSSLAIIFHIFVRYLLFVYPPISNPLTLPFLPSAPSTFPLPILPSTRSSYIWRAFAIRVITILTPSHLSPCCWVKLQS